MSNDHAALVALKVDPLGSPYWTGWNDAIDKAIAALSPSAPAGEPEPVCQHGFANWCLRCDLEAREAVAAGERGEARSFFDAGIAAAEVAVAKVSAVGRPSSFALGLAAAGEAIHALFDDDDEAWDAARSSVPEPSPAPGTVDVAQIARETHERLDRYSAQGHGPGLVCGECIIIREALTRVQGGKERV